MPNLSSVIILDQEAENLRKIDSETRKEILAPIEKLLTSTTIDSNVTRQRERYFSERKLKWLEILIVRVISSH